MSETAVVFSCAHATPEVDNSRFDLLGKFIYDLKPDYVIDLGDGADMKSLNSYDTRYPKQVVSQSYQADIEAYSDSQERLRWQFRHNKRRKPAWFGFEGNHETRIKTALKLDPRLEGRKYGISFGHLQTDHWFDEYHEYTNNAPAIHSYSGVSYSHFFGSGNYGKPISGTHHAYSLLANRHSSSTCGHSHKLSYYPKIGAYPNPIHGLVVGCFKGSAETWAGQSNGDWWKGVAVKRNIENGHYDLELVSLSQLEKMYG